MRCCIFYRCCDKLFRWNDSHYFFRAFNYTTHTQKRQATLSFSYIFFQRKFTSPSYQSMNLYLLKVCLVCLVYACVLCDFFCVPFTSYNYCLRVNVLLLRYNYNVEYQRPKDIEMIHFFWLAIFFLPNNIIFVVVVVAVGHIQMPFEISCSVNTRNILVYVD